MKCDTLSTNNDLCLKARGCLKMIVQWHSLRILWRSLETSPNGSGRSWKLRRTRHCFAERFRTSKAFKSLISNTIRILLKTGDSQGGGEGG